MYRLFIIALFIPFSPIAQVSGSYTPDSIRITIDLGKDYSPKRNTIIVFYSLPNGNTTEQTMGKKLKTGDDWHFDIQHIKAQSEFIRKTWRNKNFIVVYLENNFRSWPSWKRSHPDFPKQIPALIDSLYRAIEGKNKIVYLNGHSGGGSFIFGYFSGLQKIPDYVQRISFLDSNYGYDSNYYSIIRDWLDRDKSHALNVFAYNDSVVIYNGKPLVSATGGTWHRSRLMRNDLQKDFSIKTERNDSIISHVSADRRIHFYLRNNPEGKIYHTQQVELNGFIHSILCGTKWESKGYEYFGKRAYEEFIEE